MTDAPGANERGALPEPAVPEPATDPTITTDLGPWTAPDLFRPLEEMAQAAPWIDAQNQATDAWMAPRTDQAMLKTLGERLRIGVIGGVTTAGENVFYTRRGGDQDQPALMVEISQQPPKVLVDPATLADDGRTALDWYFPSPDGSLVAYGTSREGDEVSTLRIIEVATGEHRPDEIPFTRACSVAWRPDGQAFHYTRFPGREAYDRAVYFHTLGADPANDVQVMGSERLTERTDWPAAVADPGGRWLAVIRFVNWQKSTLHLLDLKTDRWIDIAPEGDGLFAGVDFTADRILAHSTHGAPLGRVVAIDPAKPEQADWIPLVDEIEGRPLTGMSVIPTGLVTLHEEDGVSRLTLHDAEGQETHNVSLPVPGAVGGFKAHTDSLRIWFSFQSWFFPPSLFELNVGADGRTATLRKHLQVDSGLDTSAFEVTRTSYLSYDGTEVPLTLIHRKDLPLDGRHRTILYGYGGFNVSLSPAFGRTTLFWLEQGGVYAVAHLRGGGERGEAWHAAGMGSRKYQVFQDFEYAARALIQRGYTRPDRLALMGGSNGGLLVGALITRAPHLFRAAVTHVGLYDMLRYHKFPPGALWIDEYGDPEEQAVARRLWAYSPYHQVVPGVRYPAVLALTAEQDTRVHWAHTAKFVAALQAAQAAPAEGAPILMRFQRAVGHGAGKSTSDLVREQGEVFTFLNAMLAGSDPEGAGTSSP